MFALQNLLTSKRHVIWDWNGTLLADLEHAVDVVNRLLRDHDLPATNLETYRRTFGFPVVEYYGGLGFNTEREAFLDLCTRFNEHFKAGLAACTLWPGAREVLAANRAAGKTQSLLSLSEQSLLEHSVAAYDIRSYFDFVYGVADKTATSKVARGQDLMRAARVPAEETVLIGDTIHDLEVGRALGIEVILVDHGHQTRERLGRAHHTVVSVFKPTD